MDPAYSPVIKTVTLSLPGFYAGTRSGPQCAGRGVPTAQSVQMSRPIHSGNSKDYGKSSNPSRTESAKLCTVLPPQPQTAAASSRSGWCIASASGAGSNLQHRNYFTERQEGASPRDSSPAGRRRPDETGEMGSMMVFSDSRRGAPPHPHFSSSQCLRVPVPSSQPPPLVPASSHLAAAAAALRGPLSSSGAGEGVVALPGEVEEEEEEEEGGKRERFRKGRETLSKSPRKPVQRLPTGAAEGSAQELLHASHGSGSGSFTHFISSWSAGDGVETHESRYAAMLVGEREEHRRELDRVWQRMKRAEEQFLAERDRRVELQVELQECQLLALVREEDGDRWRLQTEELEARRWSWRRTAMPEGAAPSRAATPQRASTRGGRLRTGATSSAGRPKTGGCSSDVDGTNRITTYVRDSDLLRALQRAEQRIRLLEREQRETKASGGTTGDDAKGGEARREGVVHRPPPKAEVRVVRDGAEEGRRGSTSQTFLTGKEFLSTLSPSIRGRLGENNKPHSSPAIVLPIPRVGDPPRREVGARATTSFQPKRELQTPSRSVWAHLPRRGSQEEKEDYRPISQTLSVWHQEETRNESQKTINELLSGFL